MTYVDLWVANVFEYESMIEALRKTVRPNVAYITVVQHDTGLVSSREKIVKIMKEIPNVLVLSAGHSSNNQRTSWKGVSSNPWSSENCSLPTWVLTTTHLRR